MAGSRAVSARESGQIREEAALSDSAHAPRSSLAGAEERRARPEAGFDGGCTVRLTPMSEENVEILRRIEERWNAHDVEAFLDLNHPDAVWLSSESWPETGRWEGRDSLRDWVRDFIRVWDSVRMEVRESRWEGDRVAARCAWVTRGRVSGAEGEMEWAIVLSMRDGRIARGQFYDEYDDALRALG
jgi:ketosteroid isomerase-like protein